MITNEEKEILWRAIDEYRRACGTVGLPSDLVLMARRAVERAIEDAADGAEQDAHETAWFAQASEAAMRAWNEDWPDGFDTDDAAWLFLDFKDAIRAFLRKASELGFELRAHASIVAAGSAAGQTDWIRVPGLFREHEIGPIVAGEPLNDWRIINGRPVEGSTAYEIWWRPFGVGE